jgi:hypothetical protein
VNVLLWVAQVALALLALSGGGYKVFSFDAVANMAWYPALPRSAWSALGMFEMVCAVLLIVPAAAKWRPRLTPRAAAALALESLALSGLYARYSLQLTAANPLVWSAAMALLAALVAFGRSSRA